MEGNQIGDNQTPAQGESASGKAVAALVLGILSLVACGCIAGIIAIVLGKGELNAIEAGQAPAAGRGFAKAGVIMGWISIGLTIAGVIVYLLFVFVFAAAHVSSGTAGF